MNKTCLGLIVAIVAIHPAFLFAQNAQENIENINHYSNQPAPLSHYPLPVRFFPFKDYPSQPKTEEELIAFIQDKLNQAGSPMVNLTFDDTTGDVILRYAHSGRGWVKNVRDINPKDFVWKKSRDDSSARLGGLESRKFKCASEQDAQDIESAFNRLCVMNGWTPSKY